MAVKPSVARPPAAGAEAPLAHFGDAMVNDPTAGGSSRTTTGYTGSCSEAKYSVFGVPLAEAALEAGKKRDLVNMMFQDDRWDKALQHLSQLDDWGPEMAQALLREGAAAFGFWELSTEVLAGLANQLLAKPEAKEPSAALAAWLGSSKASDSVGLQRRTTFIQQSGPERSQPAGTLTKKDLQAVKSEIEESGWTFWNGSHVRLCKFLLVLFVFIVSNAYAIKVVSYMYKGIVGLLGWPVYVARAGGMGAALFTGFLYLTMSRTLLSKVSRCVSRCSVLVACLDAHKEIHVLSAKAMLVTAFIHIAGHMLSTVPALLSEDVKDINSLLGCANTHTTSGYMRLPMEFLHYPKCPLKDNPKSTLAVLFKTTPGLTGVLLVVVLLLTWYTGKKAKRTKNFDMFWYVHNFTIVIWPLLLFAHGCNGWIGLGVPLVMFTASLPIMTYAIDRMGRALRYCLGARSVHIVKATVRPGKSGDADGALSYIQISKPRFLWDFRPGMYAFVCAPEIAPLQWHPFTICSGQSDDTVDFMIAGVGDWTRELAARCLAANAGVGKFPKVALDGPYAAPTQSAASKRVLIAVGAGVGITPFLSLLSTLISNLEEDQQRDGSLVEAHFYWTTRSADEYFFGRQLFAKIGSKPHLRDRIFLHLHVTSTAPEKDPAPYLFREALRRQSKVDQAAFSEAIKDVPMWDLQHLPMQVPWCWINGSHQDVAWVRHLLEDPEEPTTTKHKPWLSRLSRMMSFAPARQESRAMSDSTSIVVTGPTEELGSQPVASTTFSGSQVLERLPENKVLERLPENTRELASLVGSEASPAEEKGLACATGSFSTACSAAPRASEAEKAIMTQVMPISFGRPDFLTEIDAVGSARADMDIDIFACCNPMLVKELRSIAIVCNRNAQAKADINGVRPQRYSFHYERFG